MSRKTRNERPYTFDDGPDIDLEQEDIRDQHGNRVTAEYIDALVEHIRETPPAGRPSLTAPGKHSPQVAVRLPESLHAAASARARHEEKSMSALIREALEEYLANQD